MHNIVRYIRQNRIKIALIIIFIIFVISIIRAANNSYKEQEKSKIVVYENETRLETDGTITLTNKKCEEVINNFLKSCTSGDYEKAYTYLSEECKKDLYPTLESFTNDYCLAKKIKGKTYSIEKEKGSQNYKYKIEFNNMLSTGKQKSSRETTTEYYKIYVDNGHDIKISIE